MPATLYGIKKHLNCYFGGTTSGSPATWYLGLSTTTLTANDFSGSSATEPATASGYARKAITNDSTNWETNITSGSTWNKTSGSFTESTDAWGTVTSVFLADSATRAAGNIWYYYTLSPAIVVQDNTFVPYGIGSITVTGT